MEQEDSIEPLIKSIMWGKWFVNTQANDPSKKTLLLRYPTLEESMLCDFEKENYIESHKNELPSKKEIRSIAFKQGIWSVDKDRAIEKLQERLKELDVMAEDFRIKAKKAVGFKSQLRSIQKQIDYISYTVEKLITERESIFSNTVEYQAQHHQLRFLIGTVAEYKSGKSVWNADISNETDIELIDELVNGYCNKVNHLDITKIRKVARSGVWRLRWNIVKKNPENLFNRRLCDVSDEQFLLTYWSQVYDSVYEAYEPVSDDVIDDDLKLDKYLERRELERKTKNQNKYYAKNDKASLNGNEIFRIVDGYYDENGYWQEHSREEKDKIADATYSSNPAILRRMQRKAFNRLENKGGEFVPEEKLRDHTDFVVLGWDNIKK